MYAIKEHFSKLVELCQKMLNYLDQVCDQASSPEYVALLAKMDTCERHRLSPAFIKSTLNIFHFFTSGKS